MVVVIEDFDRCYRAVQRQGRPLRRLVRHRRHDDRDLLPAELPGGHAEARNVRFHPTAAAAQRAGFRACKRCRPDAAPGSPEWNVRADVVGRAMRLIADGSVDREGVAGLAAPARLQRAPAPTPAGRRARRRPARARPRAAGAETVIIGTSMPDRSTHTANQILIRVVAIITNYAGDATHEVFTQTSEGERQQLGSPKTRRLLQNMNAFSLRPNYISGRVVCCPKRRPATAGGISFSSSC